MRSYYVDEKLGRALRYMTSAPGDARERLAEAYVEFHTLRQEHFPNKKLWKEYEWVLKMLNCKKFSPDDRYIAYVGTIKANTKSMKNKTASKIIQRLQKIYDEVSRLD